MDPNANLEEQEILLTSRTYTPGYFGAAERQRLAELRQALREWLSRGGFAPKWEAHPSATTNFNLWMKRRKA